MKRGSMGPGMGPAPTSVPNLVAIDTSAPGAERNCRSWETDVWTTGTRTMRQQENPDRNEPRRKQIGTQDRPSATVRPQLQLRHRPPLRDGRGGQRPASGSVRLVVLLRGPLPA